MISIHASAREATISYLRFRLSFKISIHASAREATYFGAGTGSSLVDFNPRLREGGDRKQFTYQH